MELTENMQNTITISDNNTKCIETNRIVPAKRHLRFASRARLTQLAMRRSDCAGREILK